jgi:O-acetyl-ADP-ribose deacetylase (regulator of RNase III)
MSITIYLRDLNQTLVEAWLRTFADRPDVKPSAGQIFDIRADAIISPANSFGFMDGGIDYIYSGHLGWHVQDRLQDIIRRDHDGELPVGMAVLLPTDHADIPYLISAPTMRVPEDVSGTVNAFLAFRAALRVVVQANREQPDKITSVLCPGLGTATGRMSPQACAWQMHAAYQKILGDQPQRISSLDQVMMEHFHLLHPE